MHHSHLHSRKAATARRAALLVPLLLLLASCGGGGGGGGGSSPPPFTISLDRSSLSWSYYEGATPAPLVINASSSGTFNGTLFVTLIVENNGGVNAIDPQIPVTVIGTSGATASVVPVATLAANVYTGRIQVLACSDPACGNRVGGTPLFVGFTVNVLTPVRATPSSVTRTATSGGGVTEDVVVVAGANETGFSIGQTSPFVQLSNQSAGGFRVTLPSLPVGTYNASIPLTGSNGSRATVPVAYSVTAPPGGQQPLAVSPAGLTFATTEGASSPAQSVSVTEATWRPGLQPPEIQYNEGQNWLQISNTAGGYQVVANAIALSAGIYTARIVVRNNPLPQGISDPFQSVHEVSVSVTVGPGLVRPADVRHLIDSESTMASLSGSVVINVAGGPPVTWNAATNVSWLAINNPSGTSGSALSYAIDRDWLAQAQNFAEHVATVTVTAPGTALTAMSFPIIAAPQLAEVSGVGPRIVLTGQTANLVVSGRGFAALANPAARVGLTAQGAAPAVQRIHDGKLLLTVASINDGPHEVQVGNALIIDTSTRGIVAVPSTPHVYAAAPTGERIDTLVVDHERETLYGVHRNNPGLTDGRLYRFIPGMAGWSVESPAISAVDDVGILADGDLVVTTAPGTLRILDRATLDEEFSVNLVCTGRHDLTNGMPVTLDGRVWLGTSTNPGCSGSPLFGLLGSFDPVSRAFELLPIPVVDPPLVQVYADGPDFVMARNGERLVINQHVGIPYSTIAYLDASDRILQPTSTDTHSWGISASASDEGHRMLLDAYTVLDGQFAIAGRLNIPDYTGPMGPSPAFRVAGVISTDGTRAYVLTYRLVDINLASTTYLPRVFVLDTAGNVGDASVPVLGYFELADYPSCHSSACDLAPAAAISLDGSTLYFAGSDSLVVAPVPATLLTVP